MTCEVIIDNSLSRILKSLNRFDKYFVPTLSSRVDLFDYSKKLSSCAKNIFLVNGDCDIGHAAVYTNDHERQKAFLSSMCVDSQYRGCGLATQLLAEVIKVSRREGLGFLALEVNKGNQSALDFYRKAGFMLDEQNEDSLLMILSIGD